MGRLRLGTLDDGTFPFPAGMFFRNVPEPEWRAQLVTDAAGKIAVGHNHGLVESDDALIVIDTGYGDDTHAGRAGHLQEELIRSGHTREQVTHVVLTHAHGDHIKGNTQLQDGRRVPAFPNARYYLSRADHAWFSGPGHVPEFDEQIGAVEAAGRLSLFDDAADLPSCVTLLPTPGHTPGHTSVLLESEGRSAIFMGDVCHHPLHFSHPEWVSSFDTDPELTPRTRAALFDLAFARDALLACPHMPAPGLGRLRKDDHGYSWKPLSSELAHA